MSLFSWGFQGHDLVPNEIAEVYKQLFEDYLPGWSVDGEYNCTAAPSTQRAAVQTDRILHSGGHSWYNTALKRLLDGIDDAPSEYTKTQLMAALVNFLDEASDLANAGPDSKTGGYIGYMSKRDPLLMSSQGVIPDTDWMNAYHRTNLTWDNIMASKAAEEVLALSPRVEDGKLVYDGKLEGKGVFSKTWSEIDDFNKLSSADFSKEWAADNNIKTFKDGSVTGSADVVKHNQDYASRFLDTEIDGQKISSVGWMPKKLIQALEKAGIAGLLVSLSLSALESSDAIASEDYDSDIPNAANKNFISELIGEALSELAGMVAGALTGAVTLGLAAIPTAIAVAEAGLEFGKYLGGLFYDAFTSTANAIAESLAPVFASIAESATDLAFAMYNVAADVADVMAEYIVGVDGLFGLEGPLFGDGGPLQMASEWLGGRELLSDSGTWVYDGFGELLEGTDADDVLVHDGWGEARGGNGNDILIGWGSEYKAEGDAFFEDEGSPLATKEERLTLNGGVGDDYLIALGGTGAVLIGGEGRDFLFNTSFKGQLYGDTVDGVGQSTSGEDDSDVFWPG